MSDVAGLTSEVARWINAQRIGRLSTVDADGQPFIVPVCFTILDGAFYSPLDDKPKNVSPLKLKRVRNIRANSKVALVFDHYSEDWSTLGYASVRGEADLLEPGRGEHERAVSELRAKYPQYVRMAIDTRPLIRVRPGKCTVWGQLDDKQLRHADTLDLMRGRHSVRWYTDQPVTEHQARTLLEAAKWAPSPHGRQPWRFAVLARRETRERLADAMAAEWERQLRMDEQPDEVVRLRLRRSRDRLHRAPLVVILCLYLGGLDEYPDAARQQAEVTMAVQSLGAAAENMLLAAHAIGLEGGWMCAPLFCPDLVRSTLRLDSDLIPHAMLTFGYPEVHPKRRERMDIEDLVIWSDTAPSNNSS